MVVWNLLFNLFENGKYWQIDKGNVRVVNY